MGYILTCVLGLRGVSYSVRGHGDRKACRIRGHGDRKACCLFEVSPSLEAVWVVGLRLGGFDPWLVRKSSKVLQIMPLDVSLCLPLTVPNATERVSSMLTALGNCWQTQR